MRLHRDIDPVFKAAVHTILDRADPNPLDHELGTDRYEVRRADLLTPGQLIARIRTICRQAGTSTGPGLPLP